MPPYTGGKPRNRHAVLALNMNGGGGFEIWQYIDRTPEKAKFEIYPGDLGINIIKIKYFNIQKSYEILNEKGVKMLISIQKDPSGCQHFFFIVSLIIHFLSLTS